MSKFQDLLDLYDSGKLKFELSHLSLSIAQHAAPDNEEAFKAAVGNRGLTFNHPDEGRYEYFPLKDSSGWVLLSHDVSVEDGTVNDTGWNKRLTDTFKRLGGVQ